MLNIGSPLSWPAGNRPSFGNVINYVILNNPHGVSAARTGKSPLTRSGREAWRKQLNLKLKHRPTIYDWHTQSRENLSTVAQVALIAHAKRAAAVFPTMTKVHLIPLFTLSLAISPADGSYPFPSRQIPGLLLMSECEYIHRIAGRFISIQRDITGVPEIDNQLA